MKNKRSLLRWAGLCVVAVAVLAAFGLRAEGAPEVKRQIAVKRADLIRIDPIRAYGKLELPEVVFQHDQHTEALAKQGKDCSACHEKAPEGKGLWVYKFKRLEDKSAEQLKDVYHTNCISCHTAETKAGRKAGPLEAECRSCHSSRPDMVSSWTEIGMDKSLHFRHVDSKAIPPKDDPKVNCGVCHHVYKPELKKAVWVKGQEDSCRACHGAVPQKDPERPAFEGAAHQACISCHLEITADKMDSGPSTCFGCHSQESQAKFKTVAQVPRLERGQPDAALLLPLTGKDAQNTGELKGSMRPTAFNHKVHEEALPDCRSCHHKKIAACTECHTLEGSKEGNYIQLSQAMHQLDAKQSCVGCHAKKQAEPACAGCHATMPREIPKDACGTCHITPVGVTDAQAEDGSLLKLSKEDKTALAKATVAARSAKVEPFDQTEIPDRVQLGLLSKEYEPCDFPHRKVVKAITTAVGDNKLAAAFHAEKTTLCQGCHHNSPPSKTPPKCASCHNAGDRPGADGRPALKAAYHLQCMGCHTRMEVQKPANTACVDCHKERKD